MDGLRGVAMLFVFFGHFGTVWSQLPHPHGVVDSYLKVLDADATFGSSFFMLLSGFFAYASLMRGKHFGVFIRGRIYRLYPLYLVLVAVYVFGSILIPKMSKLPSDPLDFAIFLIGNLLFLPGLVHVRPLLDVAWTMSFIILFYFIAGGLARFFRVSGMTRPWRLLLLAVLGIVWAFVGEATDLMPVRTCIFWVGMILSEIIQGITGSRLVWATRLTIPAVVLSILGLCLRTHLMIVKPPTGIVPFMIVRTAITSATLFGVVWVAYYGPDWWKRILSRKQLCELGAVSYSYYLTHGFAIKIFRFVLFPHLGSYANTAVVFWSSQIVILVLSVLIARLVFVLVESPLSSLVSSISTSPVGLRAQLRLWWTSSLPAQAEPPASSSGERGARISNLG
ncbi:MAG: acyltransferase [Acidobacteriota bacterium]